MSPAPRILVICHSRQGKTATLVLNAAKAAAAALDSTGSVDVLCLEGTPAEGFRAAGLNVVSPKLDTDAGLRALAEYDGFLLASPVSVGGHSAALQAFLEQTTPLIASGALASKPASVLFSAATPSGGIETAIRSLHAALAHHGMLLVTPCFRGMDDDMQAGVSASAAAFVAVTGIDGNAPLSEGSLRGAARVGTTLAATARRLAAGARASP
ncbi:hypothetical protein H696_00634 [Fonticula alba]|uniref:NADPH-dependent FMN reductase-like domain-containing protein n=1 Tax=Fonticula alba TaxID=691883 RepID=A0A058ZFF9_FONAL|nr:hypothetical protein H696_00634 [Fonticula alba]KCV73089.1 hypothetical protein H696_00634 [Fonticula alba]|eukprot:XP_009492790.1 hypothetical protein H696_00634 [Fonticula alba]